MLCVASLDPEDHEQRIWRLVGYVGRYGSTPAPAALGMTVYDLTRQADALEEILVRENKPPDDP